MDGIIVAIMVMVFISKLFDGSKKIDKKNKKYDGSQSKGTDTFSDMKKAFSETVNDEDFKDITGGFLGDLINVFSDDSPDRAKQVQNKTQAKKVRSKELENRNKGKSLEMQSEMTLNKRGIGRGRSSEKQTRKISRPARPSYDMISKNDISRNEIGDHIFNKETMKEDLLKGVIYSEILSKPKSIKK